VQPASSDAGIFFAIGNQPLASKEASYNFGGVGQAKTTASREMSTQRDALAVGGKLLALEEGVTIMAAAMPFWRLQ